MILFSGITEDQIDINSFKHLVTKYPYLVTSQPYHFQTQFSEESGLTDPPNKKTRFFVVSKGRHVSINEKLLKGLSIVSTKENVCVFCACGPGWCDCYMDDDDDPGCMSCDMPLNSTAILLNRVDDISKANLTRIVKTIIWASEGKLKPIKKDFKLPRFAKKKPTTTKLLTKGKRS